MDIIISAEQGETEAARIIVARFLGFKEYAYNMPGMFWVEQVGCNASALSQKFRDHKPEVIFFDKCLLTPTDLITAVEAVKKYRQQTGRPRTLAVYVEHQPNAVLVMTDRVPRRFNEFKKFTDDPQPREAYTVSGTPDPVNKVDVESTAISEPPKKFDRTLRILYDLDETIRLQSNDTADARMAEILARFNSEDIAGVALGDRTELHQSMLALLREYEH